MNGFWMKAKLLLAAAIMLLLVACAGGAEPVAVTRLVTVPPPSPQVVEVTRLATVEVTRPVEVAATVEVTRPPLGSPERPIQLIFPPVVETAVISSRAPALVDALSQQTGYSFALGIVDSEQVAADFLCNAPVDAIGFLSPAGYAAAHADCGVTPAAGGLSDLGLAWQAGMIVVRRDSGITELADLAGRRWAVPAENSLPNTLYFQALFAELGIDVGERVTMPGDNTTMLALYNGEVDFATATYLPPILPFDEAQWAFGEDDPELWRRLGIPPTRSGIGFVVVNGRPENGGYRVRDARAGIFDTTPGVFEETEILTLSAPIPNEAAVFGPNFPVALARELTPLLAKFAASEACGTSLCSADFYNWRGMTPLEDAAYEPVHFIFEQLDLAPTDFLIP